MVERLSNACVIASVGAWPTSTNHSSATSVTSRSTSHAVPPCGTATNFSQFFRRPTQQVVTRRYGLGIIIINCWLIGDEFVAGARSKLRRQATAVCVLWCLYVLIVLGGPTDV